MKLLEKKEAIAKEVLASAKALFPHSSEFHATLALDLEEFKNKKIAIPIVNCLYGYLLFSKTNKELPQTFYHTLAWDITNIISDSTDELQTKAYSQYS